MVIGKIGNITRINRKSAISFGYKMNNYNTHYTLIKNSSRSDFYNVKTLDLENYNFGKNRKRLLRLKRALSVKLLVSK